MCFLIDDFHCLAGRETLGTAHDETVARGKAPVHFDDISDGNPRSYVELLDGIGPCNA